MAQRICSVDDCDRPRSTRGWCGMHYARWKRHGSLDLPRPMKEGPCSVPGCPNRADSINLCPAHRRRLRKTGDVQAHVPLRAPRPRNGDGCCLCSKCNERWAPLGRYYCAECQRADNIRWREANPDYWREWQRANPDKVNAAVQQRRAARLALPRERVDRNMVFERDGWICQLCLQPLDRAAAPRTSRSPSVDHIVPLAQGGHHTYANVQAAHFGCNAAKGHRL